MKCMNCLTTTRSRVAVAITATFLIVPFLTPVLASPSGADLLDALQKRNEKRAIQLLKEGAAPNTCDETKTPALVQAAYLGLEKTVSALLSSGADLRATDPDGAS